MKNVTVFHFGLFNKIYDSQLVSMLVIASWQVAIWFFAGVERYPSGNSWSMAQGLS